MTYDYSKWAWPCLLREVKAVTQDEYVDSLIMCSKGLVECPYCKHDTRKVVERWEGAEDPKIVALREELRTRVEGKGAES